jgi:molybdenum-dependent oxidoreductase-like protein
MSRIDSPAPGAPLAAGKNTISGVAYAGTRGIKRVEFSADDGDTWTEAAIVEAPLGSDAWVRWRGTFEYTPGEQARLKARATDGTDTVQDEAFTLPQPDGGTGWPHVEVG